VDDRLILFGFVLQARESAGLSQQIVQLHFAAERRTGSLGDGDAESCDESCHDRGGENSGKNSRLSHR
jgi:hypothetical protein